MKTIEEKNRMIAEFMGGKYSGQTSFDIKLDEIWLPFHGVCKLHDNGKSLKYHTSWDWLMPVVEKIETTTFQLKDGTHTDCWILTSYDNRDEFKGWSVEIEAEQLRKKFYVDKKHPSKIEATHNSVVQFIEWYNENK